MAIDTQLSPFRDDPTYLDAELRWLRCRVSRILAERQLTDAQAEEETDGDPAYARRPGRVDSRELRCRVVELRELEAKLRQEIDSRLGQSQESTAAPTLGLDSICGEHELIAEERLILLVAFPFGVSQTLAESVLGELAQHWGSIAVADAIAVLDPQRLGDWLRYRALFRPDAPLVSNGLIEIERTSGSRGPDTLPCADFRLTLETFARITGDGKVITEGEER